jgi:hypothetical protein
MTEAWQLAPGLQPVAEASGRGVGINAVPERFDLGGGGSVFDAAQAASAPTMTAFSDAPVEAMQRAVKLEALSS